MDGDVALERTIAQQHPRLGPLQVGLRSEKGGWGGGGGGGGGGRVGAAVCVWSATGVMKVAADGGGTDETHRQF